MRDYIGSADAWWIWRGTEKSYNALIKSKLRDSMYVSPQMARGITLERDIIDQCVSRKVEYQKKVQHEFLDYCSATLDGLSPRLVIEAKTSVNDAPDGAEGLIEDYPKYFYQVQWQMWVSNTIEAVILWCKCPPIDSEESPFDETGALDIEIIYIFADQFVFKAFENNAREFWPLWEKAKEGHRYG